MPLRFLQHTQCTLNYTKSVGNVKGGGRHLKYYTSVYVCMRRERTITNRAQLGHLAALLAAAAACIGERASFASLCVRRRIAVAYIYTPPALGIDVVRRVSICR